MANDEQQEHSLRGKQSFHWKLANWEHKKSSLVFKTKAADTTGDESPLLPSLVAIHGEQGQTSDNNNKTALRFVSV